MTRRALLEAYRALKTPLPPELQASMAVDAKGRPDYTARNRACLESGVHPATGNRLRPEGGTCGDCMHHVVSSGNTRTYHKCVLHYLGVSRSQASDIRVGWPACSSFEASA